MSGIIYSKILLEIRAKGFVFIIRIVLLLFVITISIYPTEFPTKPWKILIEMVFVNSRK